MSLLLPEFVNRFALRNAPCNNVNAGLGDRPAVSDRYRLCGSVNIAVMLVNPDFLQHSNFGDRAHCGTLDDGVFARLRLSAMLLTPFLETLMEPPR